MTSLVNPMGDGPTVRGSRGSSRSSRAKTRLQTAPSIAAFDNARARSVTNATRLKAPPSTIRSTILTTSQSIRFRQNSDAHTRQDTKAQDISSVTRTSSKQDNREPHTSISSKFKTSSAPGRTPSVTSFTLPRMALSTATSRALPLPPNLLPSLLNISRLSSQRKTSSQTPIPPEDTTKPPSKAKPKKKKDKIVIGPPPPLTEGEDGEWDGFSWQPSQAARARDTSSPANLPPAEVEVDIPLTRNTKSGHIVEPAQPTQESQTRSTQIPTRSQIPPKHSKRPKTPEPPPISQKRLQRYSPPDLGITVTPKRHDAPPRAVQGPSNSVGPRMAARRRKELPLFLDPDSDDDRPPTSPLVRPKTRRSCNTADLYYHLSPDTQDEIPLPPAGQKRNPIPTENDLSDPFPYMTDGILDDDKFAQYSAFLQSTENALQLEVAASSPLQNDLDIRDAISEPNLISNRVNGKSRPRPQSTYSKRASRRSLNYNYARHLLPGSQLDDGITYHHSTTQKRVSSTSHWPDRVSGTQINMSPTEVDTHDPFDRSRMDNSMGGGGLSRQFSRNGLWPENRLDDLFDQDSPPHVFNDRTTLRVEKPLTERVDENLYAQETARRRKWITPANKNALRTPDKWGKLPMSQRDSARQHIDEYVEGISRPKSAINRLSRHQGPRHARTTLRQRFIDENEMDDSPRPFKKQKVSRIVKTAQAIPNEELRPIPTIPFAEAKTLLLGKDRPAMHPVNSQLIRAGQRAIRAKKHKVARPRLPPRRDLPYLVMEADEVSPTRRSRGSGTTESIVGYPPSVDPRQFGRPGPPNPRTLPPRVGQLQFVRRNTPPQPGDIVSRSSHRALNLTATSDVTETPVSHPIATNSTQPVMSIPHPVPAEERIGDNLPQRRQERLRRELELREESGNGDDGSQVEDDGDDRGENGRVGEDDDDIQHEAEEENPDGQERDDIGDDQSETYDPAEEYELDQMDREEDRYNHGADLPFITNSIRPPPRSTTSQVHNTSTHQQSQRSRLEPTRRNEQRSSSIDRDLANLTGTQVEEVLLSIDYEAESRSISITANANTGVNQRMITSQSDPTGPTDSVNSARPHWNGATLVDHLFNMHPNTNPQRHLTTSATLLPVATYQPQGRHEARRLEGRRATLPIGPVQRQLTLTSMLQNTSIPTPGPGTSRFSKAGYSASAAATRS